MSKTKKIISLVLATMLVMAMATVAFISTSAMNADGFYVVAGAPELCGSNWDPADTNNQMTYNADKDIYEKVYTNVAAGTYEFKVTTGGAWDNGEYNLDGDASFGGPNASVTVDANGSTVTIGFNGANATVEVAAGSDEPVVTPTDAPTDAPVDTPTDAPVVGGDTITVYFTNNWAFLTQNVHYWGTDADPQWPGVAMTFVETNENGEDIYSAEIPATVTGIVFNGEHDQQPGVIRQTVDITEGIVNNAGFYCVDEADGKINVGTYEYIPAVTEPTAAPTDVEPTEAPTDVEPTQAPTDVEPTEAPTDVEPTEAPTDVEPTQAPTDVEPTEVPTEVPAANGITVAGKEYAVKVGDTVTYTVDVTAARLFENIQASVSYDADKLELQLITSDDPDVADWEVQGPEYCKNLDGVIFNAGIAGTVKFNASKVAGYNFKEGANLITLTFVVKDASASEIAIAIEEMTIKGGTESYFTGGNAVITDGITVVEALDAPQNEEPTQAPTTVDPTQAPTTVDPTQAPTTVDPTQAPTAVEPTEAPTQAPTKAPATDPTSATQPGTTTPKAEAPETGAAAYIYVVVAVLAMAACAVVVLRKKVNG